jgi:hypothetical protein
MTTRNGNADVAVALTTTAGKASRRKAILAIGLNRTFAADARMRWRRKPSCREILMIVLSYALNAKRASKNAAVRAIRSYAKNAVRPLETRTRTPN